MTKKTGSDCGLRVSAVGPDLVSGPHRFQQTAGFDGAKTARTRGPARHGASALLFAALLFTPLAAKQLEPVIKVEKNGALAYLADEKGNRVPDFSHAGYGGGGVPIPDVPVFATVALSPSTDNTKTIQSALDAAARQQPTAEGLRGTILLPRGRFPIAGQLKIQASGVVLRGNGAGEDGTVLVATGWDRRALIEVVGRTERKDLAKPVAVADSYVAAGATRLKLAGVSGLTVGSTIYVERPSPATWIEQLGLNEAPGRQPYQWQPGKFDVRWERVITAVDGETITLDVPLTLALDAAHGGGTVTPYAEGGYISHVGVENLRCEAAVDAANPLDEQHAWNAIDFHAVRDAWVSDVTGVHFAGTVVQLGAKTSRITVQDCAALAPVSEKGGYRRMPFHTRGQQTLFLRCRTEFAQHDFTVGYLAAGPNVFLECSSRESFGFSGSTGAAASGVLFDNVHIDGGSLRLDNLETWNQGVGWNAFNSMLWQSTAGTVICRSPPGAANWADGVWGQFVGNGRWSRVNEFINPDSLYRAQLAARKGDGAAQALKARSYVDARTANAAAAEVTTLLPPFDGLRADPKTGSLALKNGWLVADGRVLVGKQITTSWWLGRLEPSRSGEQGPAITRFSPGRAGTGNTDELGSVADKMVADGQVAFRHHWGLWYDRRRIDHQMIRRPDADVWPPFYELPWARSGQGTAWDGLSRYDLTKFNPWYFGRLQRFAAEAKSRGVVLVNAMYFQHNIIESGAHWVEFPWRPVNALQETGFPEPPPFNGDTIKMTREFYDVTHPLRRELHRAFIRHSLDALAGETNVIHLIGDEYSGPLEFMQFWVDVVAEWEKETGKHPLIGLSASKDVQDAILADATRAAVIDVIDFKYWFRTSKDEEYAPPGGYDAAPRQHFRKWKGGRPNSESIAGMVAEYRDRFPDKAIISDLDEAGSWDFLVAGGSFAKLPKATDPKLLAAIAKMKPTSPGGLSGGGQLFRIFSAKAPKSSTFALPADAAAMRVFEVNLQAGAVVQPGRPLQPGQSIEFGQPGTTSAWWLTR